MWIRKIFPTLLHYPHHPAYILLPYKRDQTSGELCTHCSLLTDRCGTRRAITEWVSALLVHIYVLLARVHPLAVLVSMHPLGYGVYS